jgi:hypothetical protein
LGTNSLPYKDSITSSNNDVTEGIVLFSARLSLKSLVSFAATGTPRVTKKANGRLHSPIEVLRFPAAGLPSLALY